jgi:uncharacterized protein
VITRDEMLQFLKKMKPEIAERYGIISLGLFGSVARGESRPDSDVDVVVRLREPNLFYLVHIKEALEEALHEHVDIIHYREKMNVFLKRRIDRDVIYV